jgi:Oxidoreductase molybdopterin binding domain
MIKKEALMSASNLRFINTLILGLFVMLGLTGLYGLVWPFPSLLFEIHRIAAWALILLVPWKVVISFRSLKRGMDRRIDRNLMVVVSVVLSIATLLVILWGVMWKWSLGGYYTWIAGYGYTAVGWHWGIAIGLIPPFLLHAWRRWPRPKRVDFRGRRQALKLIGLGAGAIFGWGLSEVLAQSLEEEKTPRRFSGSRERGSFTGLGFPITSGTDQGTIKLDPETWTLKLTGVVSKSLVLSYADLLAASTSQVIATLDCTGGWYSTQAWQGVRLSALLGQAGVRDEAVGLLLKGVLDYSAPFTLAQAREILLATHVGGQILDHPHGYPLRAVVPSRRGWHWVKWMTEIEVVSLF